MMADPDRNADRIATLREDVGDLRSTLREEIQSARTVVLRWGFRVVMAHVGLGCTIIAGLILAILT
jgi:hypothetical protein